MKRTLNVTSFGKEEGMDIRKETEPKEMGKATEGTGSGRDEKIWTEGYDTRDENWYQEDPDPWEQGDGREDGGWGEAEV